jgi:hypothetical protein
MDKTAPSSECFYWYQQKCGHDASPDSNDSLLAVVIRWILGNILSSLLELMRVMRKLIWDTGSFLEVPRVNLMNYNVCAADPSKGRF